MRKDVRTGAIIGGLLIAVLIIYGVVASRSHKKPAPDAVAMETEKTNPDGTDRPAGPDAAPADSSAPTSPGDATPAPVPSPAPAPAPAAPPGFDNTPPAGPAPGAEQAAPTRSGANWAALLRAENVEPLLPSRTQTPDPTVMDPGPHDAPPRVPANDFAPPPPRPSSAHGGDSSPGAASPASSDPAPNSTAATTYLVKSGDTLSSIARAAYGDARYYKKIMEANPKINPNRMRSGITITLPGRTQVAHQSAASDADSVSGTAPRRSTPPPAAPVDSSSEYRVVSNDSLYKISMKLYHTPNKVDLIYQFNKTLIGPDPARLKLNMILKLPEPPTQTASTR